jgi:hypothetical protein
VKIPTFSRQTGTTTAHHDEPTLEDARSDAAPAGPVASVVPAQTGPAQTGPARESTVAPPTAARVTTATPKPAVTTTQSSSPQTSSQSISPQTAATIDRAAAERAEAAAKAERAATDRVVDRSADSDRPTSPPVIAGPRPRASLLATLGLITGVASALLVLSGPLAGYGIGVAGLALVLSLGGVSATGRRHVAGKTDAVIGLVLALGAIVVGVLALTGSLSWLGTDMEPVSRAREWLDAQFAARF